MKHTIEELKKNEDELKMLRNALKELFAEMEDEDNDMPIL